MQDLGVNEISDGNLILKKILKNANKKFFTCCPQKCIETDGKNGKL